MEFLSQISEWGFSLNKAEISSILDNRRYYDMYASSLNEESEYYGLTLLKYDQAYKNGQMEIVIRIVILVIIVILALHLFV